MGTMNRWWVGRCCRAAQISGRSSSSALPGSWKETRTSVKCIAPFVIYQFLLIIENDLQTVIGKFNARRKHGLIDVVVKIVRKVR